MTRQGRKPRGFVVIGESVISHRPGVLVASPGTSGSGRPKCFHGTVTLDTTRVGRDAGLIAAEIIAHLSGLGRRPFDFDFFSERPLCLLSPSWPYSGRPRWLRAKGATAGGLQPRPQRAPPNANTCLVAT